MTALYSRFCYKLEGKSTKKCSNVYSNIFSSKEIWGVCVCMCGPMPGMYVLNYDFQFVYIMHLLIVYII